MFCEDIWQLGLGFQTCCRPTWEDKDQVDVLFLMWVETTSAVYIWDSSTQLGENQNMSCFPWFLWTNQDFMDCHTQAYFSRYTWSFCQKNLYESLFNNQSNSMKHTFLKDTHQSHGPGDPGSPVTSDDELSGCFSSPFHETRGSFRFHETILSFGERSDF